MKQKSAFLSVFLRIFAYFSVLLRIFAYFGVFCRILVYFSVFSCIFVYFRVLHTARMVSLCVYPLHCAFVRILFAWRAGWYPQKGCLLLTPPKKKRNRGVTLVGVRAA